MEMMAVEAPVAHVRLKKGARRGSASVYLTVPDVSVVMMVVAALAVLVPTG